MLALRPHLPPNFDQVERVVVADGLANRGVSQLGKHSLGSSLLGYRFGMLPRSH